MEDTLCTTEDICDMLLECLEAIFEEFHMAWVAYADAACFLPGLYLWGAC